MTILRQFVMVLLFVCLANSAKSQEVLPVITEVFSDNIDSLIVDSVRKQFILSHEPLSPKQLNTFNKPMKKGLYGDWVTTYMVQSPFYRIDRLPFRKVESVRDPARTEWIFYTFSFLFLVLAIANASFPDYLGRLFRIFSNPGFIYGHSREQSVQSSFPALLMSFLFLLSGAVFIYFGLESLEDFPTIHWFYIIPISTGFLFLIYRIKYLFLGFLGWIFNQKEPFKNYIQIISLVNKIAGMFMVGASLGIAFSGKMSSSLVLFISLYILLALVLLRFIRGFQVFKKQVKMSFLTFLLSFISIEVLPTMVLIKLLKDDFLSFLMMIISA
jgi:hypothetical protein